MSFMTVSAEKRALRETFLGLSPSFIRNTVKQQYKTDHPAPRALNDIWVGEYTLYEGSRRLYAVRGFDISEFWDRDGIHKPENVDWLEFTSRIGIRYGIILAHAKLPDPTQYDYLRVNVGWWLGDWVLWGLAEWRFTETGMRAFVGGTGKSSSVLSVQDLMPSDYQTGLHMYWVKVDKGWVEFGIDNHVRAVVVFSASISNTRVVKNNVHPYAILVFASEIPTTMHAHVEVVAQKPKGTPTPIDVYMPWDRVRYAEGDPCPPRAWQLYKEDTDTLLAGLSAEETVTSHPVPVFGYRGKTLYFRADGGGTLTLEVLTLAGNWREYDSVDYTAGSLEVYPMTADAVLLRAVFEPSSPPTTITDAEVVLTP